jgi:hypothetical protein
MKVYPLVRPPAYGIELTEPDQFAWDYARKKFRINFVEVFPTHHFLIGRRLIFGSPFGRGNTRIAWGYRDTAGLPAAVAACIEDLKDGRGTR